MTGTAPSSLICWRAGVAVIGFVGGHGQGRSGCLQELTDDFVVMHLATGYDEVKRPALAVDERMDLGRAPAAADADRLIALPPFQRFLRMR